MTFNLNAKSSPRNATVPAQGNSAAAASHYAPSVPISVYRELAAELQTARTMMASISSQNQQLIKQNQHLRIEIERVVQLSLQLRQIADSFPPIDRETREEFADTDNEFMVNSDYSIPDIRSRTIPPQFDKPAPKSDKFAPKSEPRVEPRFEPGAPELKELFTEQEEGRYRRPAAPERSPELNGWWLGVVIFLIVVSAFGAGFVIVRPLLPNR